VGIFSLDETNPLHSVASVPVCGSTYPSYNPSANGGLCPSRGSFQLSRPTAPGQYKIVVVPFSPMDSNGLQGCAPSPPAIRLLFHLTRSLSCSSCPASLRPPHAKRLQAAHLSRLTFAAGCAAGSSSCRTPTR
jgi:hypothetical protein